ncbi:hypothetical protein EVAR_19646_1 [Eumeta japonica]|uniref:Uncharacterized protein n=1 Tax=Eumeta variegata TaxID=151549 RepID=A0A4C1UF92_EUMVA|nr:hypothetical protein EVAR_19646_1 [Eumeta japonica]
MPRVRPLAPEFNAVASTFPGGAKREVRFGTLNVCGGMDDKIDNVCELKKDRRLDILYVNETIKKCDSNADPSKFIDMSLIKVNEDDAVLSSSYRKDYLNV